MKRVALMQPHYLPYLGFFQLMANVDEFYFYTDVQHSRSSWQVRNRIRTPALWPIAPNGELRKDDGWIWLCVPIKHPHKNIEDPSNLIRNIFINNKKDWSGDHLKTIAANYSKSPFFGDYFPDLLKILSSHWYSLMLLDVELIRGFFMKHLEIKTPTFLEHELDYDRNVTPTQRLVNFCHAVDADLFLEPGGGKAFIQDDVFKANGVDVRYLHYEPIVYEQLWPGFVPWMCMLDTLMCLGDEAKKELEVDWLEPGVMVI